MKKSDRNRYNKHGQKHGHWVERLPDGSVEEGPMVDGKKNGHWVARLVSGAVHEGPFVDDKMHGRWVVRNADGAAKTVHYVDGEPQAKSDVTHELGVQKKKSFSWKWWAVICGLIVFGGLLSKVNESMDEVAIAKLMPKCNTPTKKGDASCWLKVADRKGCWTWNEIVTDNEMFEWSGRCKNGLLHGRGEEAWRDSRNKSTGTGSYQNGKKHGDWVERSGSGDAPNEGSYKNGKRHGRWIFPFADDIVMEGSFKDGKQHGQWVLRFADGVILRRECYVNGIGIGSC